MRPHFHYGPIKWSHKMQFVFVADGGFVLSYAMPWLHFAINWQKIQNANYAITLGPNGRTDVALGRRMPPPPLWASPPAASHGGPPCSGLQPRHRPLSVTSWKRRPHIRSPHCTVYYQVAWIVNAIWSKTKCILSFKTDIYFIFLQIEKWASCQVLPLAPCIIPQCTPSHPTCRPR